MAQLNITLNAEEILQFLAKGDQTELFKKLLQKALDVILKLESEEQLHAAPGERTEERTDYRNGTRPRNLITRIGTIRLHVPRHRNESFKTMLFDYYSRSEAALIATMAEMVVNGVSTRKVSKVMETLCGAYFSKSTVSEVCKCLTDMVEEFRNRKLTANYPVVILDATYFKVREDHNVVSKAFMLAVGTTSEGKREIIGFKVYPNEKTENWEDFLQWMKDRGLANVKVFVSDANKGILKANAHIFPDAPWQRCQVHFVRDILAKVPAKYEKELKTDLRYLMKCTTIEDARKQRDYIVDKYSEILPKAMEILDNGFEDIMTVMMMPERIRIHFRTSNYIERVNMELKRRSKVIGIFPNEESLVRLMGSVLIEYNELMQTKSALFNQTIFRKILDIDDALQKKAHEQSNMLLTA